MKWGSAPGRNRRGLNNTPGPMGNEGAVRKICFTTCADEGFLEGLRGLVTSIRRLYTPEEADIVVFFDRPDDYVAAFCRARAAELHDFDEIDDWRRRLLARDQYLADKRHFYHAGFELAPGLPHHTDRGALGVDRVHHLHPLNVKAHCTAYCACVLGARNIVHIDSDAFLLARVDRLFERYPRADTVVAFDDGGESLDHLETLYGVAKPDGFDGNAYAVNAGVVFYVNGPGVQEFLTDFSFYIDSCYHYTHSGSFADQGVLRALIAKHHLLGRIAFIKEDAVNWNPTWFRADDLEFDGSRWVNRANGREQVIWHGAGGEKLWTGRYPSPSVNRAWEWVGGTQEPGPYDQVKGSLIKAHCRLLCHAIVEHFRGSGKRWLRVAEIGTQYGRTAIAFCSILGAHGYDCRVDTFDIYAPSPDYPEDHATRDQAELNVRAFGLQERITLHTVEACADISPHLAGSPHVVFIDGDHRYKQVLADCLVAKNVIAEDGIVLGDDYQLDDVRKAVWTVFGRSRVMELNHSLWAVPAEMPRVRTRAALPCDARSDRECQPECY
jgi:Methyltransferase domain